MPAIFEKLNHHQIFRKLVIVYFLFMYWLVNQQSFDLIYYAIDKGLSAGDIVLIAGSPQALMTLVLGYAIKLDIEAKQS